MKQLLIVNSTAAANGGASAPTDLSAMTAGSLGIYQLDTPTAWASAKPTTNFAIVLGRGANSPAFVIPEVDVNTLKITKATPSTGGVFSASITVPTVAVGSTYTLVLVKNGTVPHERNTWTATETAKTGDTAATVANRLRNYFKAAADAGSLDIAVSGTSAQVTITGLNKGEGWTLKAGDALYGTSITTTAATPAIGDKAYVEDLASRCAAGKGFTDVYADGDSIYPGYPEAVENTTYNIYTLRFAVGRDAAKTRDERVSQIVHIAVPVGATSASTIDTVLGFGSSNSSNSGSGSGS